MKSVQMLNSEHRTAGVWGRRRKGDSVRRCEMRDEMEENKEGRMDKGKRNLINRRFL